MSEGVDVAVGGRVLVGAGVWVSVGEGVKLGVSLAVAVGVRLAVPVAVGGGGVGEGTVGLRVAVEVSVADGGGEVADRVGDGLGEAVDVSVFTIATLAGVACSVAVLVGKVGGGRLASRVGDGASVGWAWVWQRLSR